MACSQQAVIKFFYSVPRGKLLNDLQLQIICSCRSHCKCEHLQWGEIVNEMSDAYWTQQSKLQSSLDTAICSAANVTFKSFTRCKSHLQWDLQLQIICSCRSFKSLTLWRMLWSNVGTQVYTNLLTIILVYVSLGNSTLAEDPFSQGFGSESGSGIFKMPWSVFLEAWILIQNYCMKIIIE